MTNIFKAVREGNLGAIREFREKGNIDINKLNSDGNSALGIAIYNGNLEVVKLLLEFEEIDLNQAAYIGAFNSRPQQKMGLTPVLFSLARTQPAILKALLDKGANPKQIFGSYNSTPLIFASGLNSMERTEGLRMLAILLATKDCALQHKASNGCTALENAAGLGKSNAVRLLMNSGYTHDEILTAATYAQQNGHHNLAKDMRDYVTQRKGATVMELAARVEKFYPLTAEAIRIGSVISNTRNHVSHPAIAGTSLPPAETNRSEPVISKSIGKSTSKEYDSLVKQVESLTKELKSKDEVIKTLKQELQQYQQTHSAPAATTVPLPSIQEILSGFNYASQSQRSSTFFPGATLRDLASLACSVQPPDRSTQEQPGFSLPG